MLNQQKYDEQRNKIANMFYILDCIIDLSCSEIKFEWITQIGGEWHCPTTANVYAVEHEEGHESAGDSWC